MNRNAMNGDAARLVARVGVLGLTLFAGAANAEVVVFDNSDQAFFWKLGISDIDGTQYPGTFLDITKSAAEQTGERLAGTIGKWYYPNNASDEPAIRDLIGEAGVQTARTTDWVSIKWKDRTFIVKPTRDYVPGESVSSSDNWALESIYFWHLPFSMSFEGGSPGIGDPAYLGVRVKGADEQWHYGWILFSEYQWPLAWAYETEPNTPIQIPIPAPGGVLAVTIGAAGILGIRRRRM